MSYTDETRLQKLLGLGVGYWKSKAFLSACDLKLFTLVSQGADSVSKIACTLQIPLRSTGILMNVMTSQGLFEKNGDVYKITDLSSEFLVEGAWNYIGDFFIGINRMFYRPFVEFEQALLNGRPVWSVDARGRHIPIPRDEVGVFAKAMHAVSKLTGRAFGKSQKLSECRRLLDVGGGTGLMSINAAKQNLHLEALVMDRPLVCQIAQEYVSESGLSHRIKTLDSDFIIDEYPVGFDVHLYSNIFHNFDDNICRNLLLKSFRSMTSNGQIFLIDYLLEDHETGPEFSVVFNLFSMVAMENGGTRTFSEYKMWLQDAGFIGVNHEPICGPFSLIHGKKV